MNVLNQLKWNFSRKSSFEKINKRLSLQQKIMKKSTQKNIPKSIKLTKYLEESFRFHFLHYFSKSLKLIFKICLVSFCLKTALYALRQQHKAYIRDLSYMQAYGYAKFTNYENLMFGKNNFEFYVFPYSFFHSVKYNQKDPVNSFLKVFDNYLNHPKFGSELGEFIFMLLKYEPLRPPRNDFISILVSDYINSDDFMDSLIRLLKIWFLNDDFKKAIVQKIQDALFSEKVKFSLLDALLNEVMILIELPEIKALKHEILEFFSKPENNKDTALSMSDPVKVKKALKKIKKDKVFYNDSPPYDDFFMLTKYNKFYLRTIYDFMLVEPDTPIVDYNYYENPLFKYSKAAAELYPDD